MIKLKRSTKQYIIVAAICIVVVGGAALLAYFISTRNIKDTYEGKLAEANLMLENNKRNVYVATEDILAGGIITAENTENKEVLSSQAQETFIDASDIGKVALVNINAGTQITRAIVTDAVVTSDLREANFNVILNSDNIANNDTVDVRIFYPNGENYIVLSKKTILNMTEGSTECYFWLSEEEIQLMSSAIVDAYLYQGAQLYTTEYIEPSIQEAAIVTYTPSLATINLIKEDPNIVNIATTYLSTMVRKGLENRLAASAKQDVKETEWEIDTNQTAESQPINTQDDNYYYVDQEKDKLEDREYGE